MDQPLFSQIPSIILKKTRPRVIKFLDESPSIFGEEVSSSRRDLQPSENDELYEDQDMTIERPKKSSLKTNKTKRPEPFDVETADAKIQTDLKPDTIERGTQTDVTCGRASLAEIFHEQYQNQLEAQSLAGYKPMFAIPKCEGQAPPLKIGLTLPKGKKRKVYYPDDDN